MKVAKILFLKSFHLNAYHCDTLDLVVLLLLLGMRLSHIDYTFNILKDLNIFGGFWHLKLKCIVISSLRKRGLC